MKFRIITTLILLVVLALVYAVVESNQPQQPSQGQPDSIILH